MYVGDSITHGHTGPASYRWAMHKIPVDNGISYDEVGCNTGNNGGGVSPGTVYGGVAFENEHSALSSARAWEIAGRKDGPRFGHSNIYNWLGLSDTRNDGATYTGKTFTGENTPETFFLMIGTNDTLSDFSGAGIGGNNGENLNQALINLLGYDSSTQKFSQSGDMDKILTAMRQANSSADITVSSLPCWMDGRGNNNNAQDFAAITLRNSEITLSSLGGATVLALTSSVLKVTGNSSTLQSITMDIASSLALASIEGDIDDPFYITLQGNNVDVSKLSVTQTGVTHGDGVPLDNVYILANGITYTAKIAWLDQQGTSRNLVVGTIIIPEPTTATLSLLALAALAARRRRK